MKASHTFTKSWYLLAEVSTYTLRYQQYPKKLSITPIVLQINELLWGREGKCTVEVKLNCKSSFIWKICEKYSYRGFWKLQIWSIWFIKNKNTIYKDDRIVKVTFIALQPEYNGKSDVSQHSWSTLLDKTHIAPPPWCWTRGNVISLLFLLSQT